jgi:hypothetical protein
MFTVGWVEMPGAGRKFNLTNKVADTVLGGKSTAASPLVPALRTGQRQQPDHPLRPRLRYNGADIVGPITKIDEERGAGKPYLDPMAFRDPLWQFNKDGILRFGTIGKGILHGPGYWQLNPRSTRPRRPSGKRRVPRGVVQPHEHARWNNPSSGVNIETDPNTGALQPTSVRHRAGQLCASPTRVQAAGPSTCDSLLNASA